MCLYDPCRQPPALPEAVILIIEDDKAYANVYKIKIAGEGYEVVVAYDGDAGLQELRKRTCDLLILDLG